MPPEIALVLILTRSLSVRDLIRHSWAASTPEYEKTFYLSNRVSPDVPLDNNTIPLGAYSKRHANGAVQQCCEQRVHGGFFCSNHSRATYRYQHIFIDMLVHALNHRWRDHHQWLVVADDDTWIFPSRLNSLLVNYIPSHQRLLVGEFAFENSPHPVLCGGAGYVLTRAAITRSFIHRLAHSNLTCMQSDWVVTKSALDDKIELSMELGCGSCSDAEDTAKRAIQGGKCFFAQHADYAWDDLVSYDYAFHTLAMAHNIPFAYWDVYPAQPLAQPFKMDLLIAGPAKTGTTSLATAALQQGYAAANFSTSDSKESHFFDGLASKRTPSYFAHSFDAHKLKLEATPCNFRIGQFIFMSNVRFQRAVVGVRNPADRLFSLFVHAQQETHKNIAWTNDLIRNFSTFRDVWESRHSNPRFMDAVRDGVYAPYVRGWRAMLGDGLVLVETDKLDDTSYWDVTLRRLGLESHKKLHLNEEAYHRIQNPVETERQAVIDCRTQDEISAVYHASVSLLLVDEPQVSDIRTPKKKCAAV